MKENEKFNKECKDIKKDVYLGLNMVADNVDTLGVEESANRAKRILSIGFSDIINAKRKEQK